MESILPLELSACLNFVIRLGGLTLLIRPMSDPFRNSLGPPMARFVLARVALATFSLGKLLTDSSTIIIGRPILTIRIGLSSLIF
jgi:hypothetical protein